MIAAGPMKATFTPAYERRFCPVHDLKVGMQVGSPATLLYTVVKDAYVTRAGTVIAEIEYADERGRQTREWVYGDNMVAVRAPVAALGEERS